MIPSLPDTGQEWPFHAFPDVRKKLRILDLFSGIGGFSLGLERTGGFETVAFCEIEAFPRKVLAKHWPDVPCYDDVRELTAERLAADGIAVDVITGGFPCQDLSASGKQAGISAERSGLYGEVIRLARELRPRFIAMENVANLLVGERGDWFGTVLGDLAGIGYDAEWFYIPADWMGAPHARPRAWIVAYPNEIGCGGLALGFDTLRQFERRASKEVWASELAPSPICRMDDGVPNRVERLAALGNAVVPQIPELIGNAILAALHLSPIPYRPEDEQDWRRSILSGIAFGPRLHPTGRACSPGASRISR